jgi:hypothetical protein
VHVVGEDVAEHKAHIARALGEAGVEVQALDVIAPSLEDVFISKVREQEAGGNGQ